MTRPMTKGEETVVKALAAVMKDLRTSDRWIDREMALRLAHPTPEMRRFVQNAAKAIDSQ